MQILKKIGNSEGFLNVQDLKLIQNQAYNESEVFVSACPQCSAHSAHTTHSLYIG